MWAGVVFIFFIRVVVNRGIRPGRTDVENGCMSAVDGFFNGVAARSFLKAASSAVDAPFAHRGARLENFPFDFCVGERTMTIGVRTEIGLREKII